MPRYRKYLTAVLAEFDGTRSEGAGSNGWRDCDLDQIAQGIGATRAEVDLLYQDSIFKARNLQDYRYSKAWVPEERKAR